MFEQEVGKWLEFMQRYPSSEVLFSPPDARNFNLFQMGVDVEEPTAEVKYLPEPPWVLDQFITPWCVAYACVHAYNSYFNALGTLPPGGFSPSFLMALCKMHDGVPHLPGTYLSTANKVMRQFGVCRESVCPTNNTSTEFPIITQEMLDDAAKYKIKGYARIYNISEIRQAHNAGKYILSGTLVTRQNWFENTKDNGYLGMPEGKILGAHATMGLGYDNKAVYRTFTGYTGKVNSWGTEWGDSGKFYMPYPYLTWKSDIGITAYMEGWALEFENIPPDLTNRFTIFMNIGDPITRVNGFRRQIDPDNSKVTPIIYSNWQRTLLPLRFLAEILGMQVQWDAIHKKVTLARGLTTVEMWIGNPIAKVNGQDILIDDTNTSVTPITYSNWGRTMLPVRFISQVFGVRVFWNEDKKEVVLER